MVMVIWTVKSITQKSEKVGHFMQIDVNSQQMSPLTGSQVNFQVSDWYSWLAISLLSECALWPFVTCLTKITN